jgi:molybdopterin-guanine dinucleotide biosynthesis protein A
MLARIVGRLARAVDAVTVNCRPDQREAFASAVERREIDAPVGFAIDADPDRGPLAGVGTALGAVEATRAAVVGCDMPGLDPDFLAFLFREARGHDAAVPELRSGHRQPLQAVYRVEAMRAAAERRLAAGERSLRGALDCLDVAVVGPDTITERGAWRSLRDVNTRAELASFLDRPP